VGEDDVELIAAEKCAQLGVGAELVEGAYLTLYCGNYYDIDPSIAQLRYETSIVLTANDQGLRKTRGGVQQVVEDVEVCTTLDQAGAEMTYAGERCRNWIWSWIWIWSWTGV